MKNIHQLSTLDCFRDYIGIPYEEYDCYEIIQKFYKEVFNQDLTHLYTARPDKEETAIFIKEEQEKFEQVEFPVFGDIIVFKVFGLASHVGMYVNEDVFFHSRKNVNSSLEKLSLWKKRVVGYYRWPLQKFE